MDVKQWSLLGPVRAVFRETGSWIMVIVSFLFSISAVIGKLAILHSSVLFFQMAFFAALSIVLAGFVLAMGKISLATFLQYPGKGAVAGVLLFLHILFHGFAIAMTKAAYMIAIKRMSVLFGVIYGGLVFDEENMAIRFSGALLMFGGSVIILIRGQ